MVSVVSLLSLSACLVLITPLELFFTDRATPGLLMADSSDQQISSESACQNTTDWCRWETKLFVQICVGAPLSVGA